MTAGSPAAHTLKAMDPETEALLERSARGRAHSEQLLRESELRMAVVEAKVQQAQLMWEAMMRDLRAAGLIKTPRRPRRW